MSDIFPVLLCYADNALLYKPFIVHCTPPLNMMCTNRDFCMTCSTAMLPLPKGVSLKSCTYKASPLIIDYCIIPSTFHSYREFVSVLEPYVQLEAEFVRNFMQKPRSCYEACFQEEGEDKLKAVHPEGNLLAILQEVRRTVSPTV